MDSVDNGAAGTRPQVRDRRGTGHRGIATRSACVSSGILGRTRFMADQSEAIRLGTLYALGHGLIVVVLGSQLLIGRRVAVAT